MKKLHSRTVSCNKELKRKCLKDIKILIEIGENFLRENNQEFNYEKWRIDSSNILELFDKICNTKFKSNFDEGTKHDLALVFKKAQGVEKGTQILKTAYDILNN